MSEPKAPAGALPPEARADQSAGGPGALRPVPPETLSSVTISDKTGRFLAVLSQLGCSIALSTDESRLLLVGSAEAKPTLAAMVLPRMRGLAAQGDLIALGSAASVYVFKADRRLGAVAPHAPDTYDAVFVPLAIQFTGSCDFHDMAFVGGTIVAVNTRYSCVCKVDGVHSFTPIWRPPFITALRPEDRCHLNGMALVGNQLRYVTMLGMSDEAGGWRHSFMDGGGVLMEAATGKVVAIDLSLPHSPRVVGERLLCRESGRGHLLQIDPDTGAKQILARLPGFTHGLSEIGGAVFIGLSKLRSRRPGRRLPLEEEGVEPICGVAALNAATFELIGILEIPSGVEEVYDLQLLPGIRNPDILSPEQAREHHAIDLPDEAFWATEPEALR